MGRRGPAPTPTTVLEKRGSWLAKKRGSEPAPAGGPPRPPDHLDPAEQTAWAAAVHQLYEMRLLAEADANALERYARMVVRWRKAARFIADYGETYPLKDNAGNVRCFQPFPEVAIYNQLATALLRLEQEFGLTPSARARIGIDRAQNDQAAPQKDRFFVD